MNKIGRKIYYDKATGNVILDTGEKMGAVVDTTIDQDFETYQALKERVRDTVGVIQLEFGQYAEDFAQCNGYRVNPETLELEFSYPDPNATEPQEPVYVKPLTEQVKELEQQNAELLLDLVMKDGRIAEVEQTQADLILDLTMKGVI
jgi:hypothetical protein